ncbi:MAG: hypothetical protein H7061_02475 [Bdellovibrionaceae bacterium]|nr:hypothetical protein [Bdellovibrio sp.]
MSSRYPIKKIVTALAIVFAIIFSVALYGQSFWGGKTMSAKQIKTKWGAEKLDADKFRTGNYEIKSKMAYAILTDKTLVGKSYDEIRKLFGENDGFYFVDTFPTYIIQRGKDHSEDTWQIVFRMDRNFKVRDVIMHKNCCER